MSFFRVMVGHFFGEVSCGFLMCVFGVENELFIHRFGFDLFFVGFESFHNVRFVAKIGLIFL